MVLASDQQIAGLGNGLGLLLIDGAHGQVGGSSRLLHIGKAANQRRHLRHGLARDGEIFHSTCRMHAPVGVVGNVLGTQKVAFLTHDDHSPMQ